MSIIDIGKLGPRGSGEATGYLAHKIDEVRDMKFMAGVWGLFLGAWLYVMIFKP